jgi:hypothetical protein
LTQKKIILFQLSVFISEQIKHLFSIKILAYEIVSILKHLILKEHLQISVILITNSINQYKIKNIFLIEILRPVVCRVDYMNTTRKKKVSRVKIV